MSRPTRGGAALELPTSRVGRVGTRDLLALTRLMTGALADESDSWVSNKSFVPSTGARRFGSNGGGFDTHRERRWGFESNGGGGGADSEDRWGKKEITGTGGAFDSLRERRGGVGGGGDLDNWKREEGSESGGGRPRLNLQPRSMAVDQQSKTAAAVKPKGSNPFGNARPSEENLKEKGQDWKESLDQQPFPLQQEENLKATLRRQVKTLQNEYEMQ
ncbi:hypothetical protein RJ639_042471 [Escallonia herrerae]|uniref:Uncharacterized protein n=1 Tax=Escallonia herrerae TaxID=1293975 RepID=A0AA88WH31_9ASTE|nr:hypothetical protein RJ639_042471 [Escallonia herrerae]